MGPLISADQREQVSSYVDDGVAVAARGQAPEGPGYWFPPTVLAPVSNDDRAAREEIFGPVVCVIPFDDEADAVRRPTTRSTGSRARSGPRTAPARCAWHGRSTRACCRSTPTPRCGWPPPSAASSSRAWGASSARRARALHGREERLLRAPRARSKRLEGKVCVVTGAACGHRRRVGARVRGRGRAWWASTSESAPRATSPSRPT